MVAGPEREEDIGQHTPRMYSGSTVVSAIVRTGTPSPHSPNLPESPLGDRRLAVEDGLDGDAAAATARAALPARAEEVREDGIVAAPFERSEPSSGGGLPRR